MSTQSKKEYLVSIVTPFHNVDMRLFRKGYESLINQTIGFSNIQWIVVLHNTEPSICEAVHQLLDCHENVIVKELNNDVHTPSSPRNCGMKLATAPYLGFLDADDQLVIMLEPMEGRNGNNVFSPDVTKKIAAFLDAALCDENVAYAAARQAGTPPCTFAWIQSQTQLLYRDATRFRNKTATDQIRPRHFLNTPAQIKFFRHEVL